jgi:prepilin-type N-terminal cleavage/methylation domain-containing protein
MYPMFTTSKHRGFTLVELIVSISIFAMMTALVVAKYGTFNQSVLLTNLAYDMALTIRTAQTYGVSVKSENDSFNTAYGIYLSSNTSSNTQFIFFADRDVDGLYDIGEEIKIYSLKRGAIISELCFNVTCLNNPTEILNITFKRPDPDALIQGEGGLTPPDGEAKIVIMGTDGSTRAVVVRENGQISVEQ